MDFRTFSDSDIPQAYGLYLHAVMAGDFVFISGQTGRDAQTSRVIDGDIAAQTQRALEIITSILGKLGLKSKNVARTTVYLANINDFAAMNHVYASVFPAPHPARSTVQVTLPYGALVAFDAVAYHDQK